MDPALTYEALTELCRRIELCGASLELTRAVILCSDLRQAIGNKWNPADKYAEQRVRAALGEAPDLPIIPRHERTLPFQCEMGSCEIMEVVRCWCQSNAYLGYQPMEPIEGVL